MNGPIVSVNTTRNINSISRIIIGASQYFFCFFMNSNSSFNVPSFPLFIHPLVELSFPQLTYCILILQQVYGH